MAERTQSGVEINFSEHCSYLSRHGSCRPVRLFFNIDDTNIIASETSCPNGGLPGVEKRSDSGFLVPIYQDKIVVSCDGCTKLKGGFEHKLENIPS